MTCMSLPTPALTSDWVIFDQKFIQSCPTTSNTNHHGTSRCLWSQRWGEWGYDTKLSIQGLGQFLGLCPPHHYRPTLTPAHQGSLDLGPASGHWCTCPFRVPCSDHAIGLFLATGEPWLECDGELVERLMSTPVIARPALSHAVLVPSCQDAIRKVLLGNFSVLPVVSGTKHTPDHFIL